MYYITLYFDNLLLYLHINYFTQNFVSQILWKYSFQIRISKKKLEFNAQLLCVYK